MCRFIINVTYLTLFIYLTLNVSEGSKQQDFISNEADAANKEFTSLINITEAFYEEFETIKSQELGINFIQAMYEKFKYIEIPEDVNKSLEKIALKLESKLNESIEILNNTLNNNDLKSFNSMAYPCNNEDLINSNGILKESVDKSMKLKAVKHHFFLSDKDLIGNHEINLTRCKNLHQSMIWNNYVRQMKSKRRNVVLLIDHGGSLSRQQFKLVKALSKQMVDVLNENDTIKVIAISDTWSSPYLTEHCVMPNQGLKKGELFNITSATEHNKELIYMFIDALDKGNSATNHSLGFQKALEAIQYHDQLNNNETTMLLFVGRGLISSITEPKSTLEMIGNLLKQITTPVIINTCAIIDESKPVMYETQFLHDLAEQNYTKYNLDGFKLDINLKGIMLQVNSSESIGLAIARFYATLNDKIEITQDNEEVFEVSTPKWDSLTKDLTILLTKQIKGQGMLGLSLYYSNLVEDVTYYSNNQLNTYSFIIDTKGTTIMHPSYPRPMSVTRQINFVDIKYLEKNNQDFHLVKEAMLNTGRSLKNGSIEINKIKYMWKNVLNCYIVCMVVKEEAYKIKREFPSSTNSKLIHHRFDMLHVRPNLCKHFNQLATLEAGVLYLSPSCFQSPFAYIHSSNGDIQSYMAYLKDETRMISNPGLREEIRDDVSALALIMEYLRTQHLSGNKAKYVVRRYLATQSGVLTVFPGIVIDQSMEPTKRSWFIQAMENKHNLILSPPYLDYGGAGYIITLSYATNNLVVAMDVTFGFIYKLLIEKIPACKSQVKCFLMDDRGYLIYHPKLIDPNGHGPIEQQHIIHKESLIANDILNHNYLVKKMLCNDYSDGTIQRFYRLNTSLGDKAVEGGDHCVKYQLKSVNLSNVFITVVKTNCKKIGTTFCPCSMVNRLCLNCNRMEQNECECPCECPLNLDICIHANKSLINNDLCHYSFKHKEERNREFDHVVDKESEKLSSCLPIICESLTSYESCLGVLGCEWCVKDADGETALNSPFCTSLLSCFNGVLGSPTPYGFAQNELNNARDLSNTYSSPLGPVIGSVIGIGVILVLLFFCYRSYTSSSSQNLDRFYLNSSAQNHQMSDLNVSGNYDEIEDKLLQDNKKANKVVSPYCVSTGYRRPQTAADSDHGYSTMTPHDESEHLSLAPVEIDSLEEDCISDATSINTSVSLNKAAMSKMKKVERPTPQTCIIAPVTVHRNMEHAQ